MPRYRGLFQRPDGDEGVQHTQLLAASSAGASALKILEVFTTVGTCMAQPFDDLGGETWGLDHSSISS